MKKYLFTIFALNFLLTTSILAEKNIDSDAITGMWFTKSKSKNSSIIEIYKQNNKYQGRILWISNPFDDKGNYQLDVNNPNKENRLKPIIGLTILKGFEFKENKWENGTVYDPENGNTYKASIWLSEHATKLHLRGFIGISLLGRTEIWTRVN